MNLFRSILVISVLVWMSAGSVGAFWGYDEMAKKAGGFSKQPGFDTGKVIIENSKFDPAQDNVPRVFGFITTLTDEQVSQIVNSMDLKYVDKVYVAFSDQNEIQVWARSFVANARFKYDQQSGVDVAIDSVKAGVFTVPGNWLAGMDKPLEAAINKIIANLKQKNSLEVLEIRTENGKIIFRTRVTNLDWLVKT